MGSFFLIFSNGTHLYISGTKTFIWWKIYKGIQGFFFTQWVPGTHWILNRYATALERSPILFPPCAPKITKEIKLISLSSCFMFPTTEPLAFSWHLPHSIGWSRWNSTPSPEKASWWGNANGPLHWLKLWFAHTYWLESSPFMQIVDGQNSPKSSLQKEWDIQWRPRLPNKSMNLVSPSQSWK